MTKKTLEKALELAIKERFTGDCPFDSQDTKVECVNGDEKCNNQVEKCWLKYFIAQAEKEVG